MPVCLALLAALGIAHSARAAALRPIRLHAPSAPAPSLPLLLPHGLPEAPLLERAVERLLESPSARELALELAAEDRPVLLTVESLEGVRAEARLSRVPIEVAIDPDELAADPSLAVAAGDLGHELLGHALRRMQAGELGLGRAYDRSLDDERNALLVGWVVEAELGGPVQDGWLGRYLSDPAGFPERLALVSPFEAGLLTRAQMEDPVTSYRRRLEVLPAPPAGKEALFKKIRENLEWLAYRLGSRRGRGELRALQQAARSPFLAELEREIEALGSRLRALLKS